MRKNLNRRNFLKKCALGAGGVMVLNSLTSVADAAGEGERPNILWLIAEDLCPDLGCYGTPVVRTPNIDRLASEGALYTDAFTTAPVCSPSRSAFMTGMYQTSIGVHHHRSNRDKPLPADVNVITDYFRDGGYFTSNCGNMEWTSPGKTDFNFEVSKPFDGTDWRQRKQGQPFYAQVNFSETHRAFKRDAVNPIEPDKVVLPPYYPDHPITRRDWANYLECAQVLDRKVGEVLKRLEDDGLTNNTIVFFFGDHGRPHVRGKQFLYEGGIHIPLIIRWPGHIRPGTVEDCLVSAIDFGPTCLKLAGIEPPSHLQGQVFLGPNAKMREYIAAARDRCDETYDRIRCVRTKQFKYIRNFFPNYSYTQTNLYKKRAYPVLTLMEVLYAQGKLTTEQNKFMASIRPVEELYDLIDDPYEVHNLADEPKYQTVLKELRAILDKWIKETGDQGEISEDPKIAVEWYQDVLFPNHQQTMRKRGLSPDVPPMEYLEYWKKELMGNER